MTNKGESPATFRIGRRTRRLTLIVHITSAGTWLGLDAAFAVLAYTALLSDDVETAGAAFQMLTIVAVWPMLSVALLNLGTGLVLALGTKYGLFKYWWVIVKLGINVTFSTLIILALRPELGRIAAAGRQLANHETSSVPIGILPYPLTVGPLLLLTAVTISVIKPWGRVSR